MNHIYENSEWTRYSMIVFRWTKGGYPYYSPFWPKFHEFWRFLEKEKYFLCQKCLKIDSRETSLMRWDKHKTIKWDQHNVHLLMTCIWTPDWGRQRVKQRSVHLKKCIYNKQTILFQETESIVVSMEPKWILRHNIPTTKLTYGLKGSCKFVVVSM